MENTSFKDVFDGKYLHHLNFGSAAHAACRSLNNSERLFSENNLGRERLWKGLEKKKPERKSMASLCSGETEITWETSYIFAKGSGKSGSDLITGAHAHAARPDRRGQSFNRQSKSWTFLEFPPRRSPDVSAAGRRSRPLTRCHVPFRLPTGGRRTL